MAVGSLLTCKAVEYCINELLRRTGVGVDTKNAPIRVVYGEPDNEGLRGPTIVIRRCPEPAFRKLIENPFSIDWLDSRSVFPAHRQTLIPDPVPVMFWGSNRYGRYRFPFAEQVSHDCIMINADIVAATFFMLTRWEETQVPARDEHGRFPASESVAFKHGFLGRPVVDEYALILSEWVKVLLPGWEPEKHQFAVRLTQDIDHIQCFSSLPKVFRRIVRDLVKRDKWSLSVIDTLQAVRSVRSLESDPYAKGILYLARLAEIYQLRSVFYFMAAEPGVYDEGYKVDRHDIRRIIHDLQRNGHEVGLHPSYRSFLDIDQLAKEKRVFDAVVGHGHYGGRQHYLRFKAPVTWRHLEQVGLTHDSTVGYADHEGFRCGTCHPFKPYDLEQDREMNLFEAPLIVMDTTLSCYRNMNLEQASEATLLLAERCRRVGGTFTLLWHNNSLCTCAKHGWSYSPSCAYVAILDAISKIGWGA